MNSTDAVVKAKADGGVMTAAAAAAAMAVVAVMAVVVVVAALGPVPACYAQTEPSALEQIKQAIVSKNIFKPAKVPANPATGTISEALAADLGPKPLKKPFTVLGIRITQEGSWADLYFEDPSRVEKASVDQVFEKTLKILAIEPTFLRCEYAGQEVRLAVGESTNDALARLRGFDSSYILLGTRAAGSAFVADILILRDNTTKTIEVGDLLGDARVTKIEDGRVHLVDQDGTEFPIE